MGIQDQISQLKKAFGEKDLPSDGASLRETGDRLRDAGQFPEAADAYGRYLKVRPDDFKIWVQYGNCLKDAGKLTTARLAYESATALDCEDADLHLQMGHLMKLQGRFAEAAKLYRKSYALNPTSGAAARELAKLGTAPRSSFLSLAGADLSSKQLKIFDISDLLVFLNVHNRLTGIQRVESNLMHELLLDADHAGWMSSVSGHHVVFASCDQLNQTVYALSTAAVQGLLAVLRSADPSLEDVRECLDNLDASRVPLSPKAGDIYVILGAYWIGHDYSGTLVELKRKGVRIGVYVYDLIPLTHPHFLDTEATGQIIFEKFNDIMRLADFALAISNFVANEARAVIKSELNREIPVIATPLSHEFPETDAQESEIDDDFTAALPREFVLCAGTLEGRKNHALLLNVWSALNRKHGGDIPHLVLVGKWGWRIDAFRAQLELQNHVDGKIVVMGNLSDLQLKILYQRCLFSIFPSFVEGWGLPVGESLALGKPCIASKTSSIPEVGGDFCRYIDPHDPLSAAEIIERAIFDREGLRSWTKRIVDDFKVRRWADVAADLLAKVDDAVQSGGAKAVPASVTLEAGRLYQIGQGATDARDKASGGSRAVKYACAAGWWPIEGWGAWSFSRNARIEFATSLAPGSRIRLMLNLRLPPPTDRDSLRLVDSLNNAKTVYFPDGASKWVQMEVETDRLGVVTVSLERSGPVQHVEADRKLYCGISSIAYYSRDDLTARLDLMESILLFDAR